jgi:DNA repair protein RadC
LLDASLVHPREVFQYAIRASAASVVLAHNHPSGDPTPSAEDVRMTKQLVAAGRIVGIAVLDHVVLGAKTETGWSYTSLREQGLADFGAVEPPADGARPGSSAG